jgi:hypothetical protein
MTITTIDSCLRQVTAFCAYLLLTGWLAAQTVPAMPSQANLATTSSAPPACTPTGELSGDRR